MSVTKQQFRYQGTIIWFTYRVCEVLMSHPEGCAQHVIVTQTNSNGASLRPILQLMAKRGLLYSVQPGTASNAKITYFPTEKTEDLLQHYRGIKRLLR
jgi:predicted transcriptional regulator